MRYDIEEKILIGNQFFSGGIMSLKRVLLKCFIMLSVAIWLGSKMEPQLNDVEYWVITVCFIYAGGFIVIKWFDDLDKFEEKDKIFKES